MTAADPATVAGLDPNNGGIDCEAGMELAGNTGARHLGTRRWWHFWDKNLIKRLGMG